MANRSVVTAIQSVRRFTARQAARNHQSGEA